MNQFDKTYLELLHKLLIKYASGNVRDERTKTGAVSLFGYQMRFNLQEGFPLLTTKAVHFHSVLHELLWFIKGDTNIRYLLQNNVHIWTDWRYKEFCKEAINTLSKQEFEQLIVNDPKFAEQWGGIGKGYGHQWRNFGELTQWEYDTEDTPVGLSTVCHGVDQLKWVINEIKTNPTSRRLIVSGWNPQEIDKVDLPPCHTMYQFFVEDGKLSCQLYQRSADVFLGVPFNIASYALLTHLIAYECDLDVGEFIWTGGDTHLYVNHVDQANMQIINPKYPAPKLELNLNGKSIFDLDGSEISITGYRNAGKLSAPVAV